MAADFVRCTWQFGRFVRNAATAVVVNLGLLWCLALAAFFFRTPVALAHAFLDHAAPAVGSSVAPAPAAVKLWFTEQLEPSFSSVEVTDPSGKRVDAGDAKVVPGDGTELEATLKPLPPGTYKVIWHVVSADTHRTEGTFTFTVGR
jgi:hypothetical protein